MRSRKPGKDELPDWKRERLWRMLLARLPIEECAEILEVPAAIINKEIQAADELVSAACEEFGEDRAATFLLDRIREAASKGDIGARAWLRERNLLQDDE